MNAIQWLVLIFGVAAIAWVIWYFFLGKRAAVQANSSATGTHEITIPVSEMTCASCQAHVQKALADTPGVETAAVNFLTQQATVVYNAAQTSPDGLVSAVRATGYGAELPKSNLSEFEDETGASRLKVTNTTTC